MNGPDWTIRPADTADAADIVTIIRDAFPAQLLELFIYGCSGIAKFIAEQISVQEHGGDTHYSVATAGSEVVACAEVRRLPQRLFLNYIAVRPPFRTMGLGSHLLHNALSNHGLSDRGEIALDVFDFNADVHQWYERLGFRRHETTVWLQATLDENQPAPVRLAGYAQAQACHREYGFSKFTVYTADRHDDVGRLGEDWYRLTDSEALASPGFAAGLKQLSPKRRLLLLSKLGSQNIMLSNTREAARTHRLVASLNTLRQRLKNSRQEA